jgi:hypothetical protein
LTGSNGSPCDDENEPVKRGYALWLRMLALVVALALGAWFVDILITAILHSAAH